MAQPDNTPDAPDYDDNEPYDYDDEEDEGVHLLSDEDCEHDQFLTDAEADADALASAGWGTDEDYGGYDDFGGES